nr:MAG TPA: hypothetical protein [Bacteriophage sp.]
MLSCRLHNAGMVNKLYLYNLLKCYRSFIPYLL